MDIMSSPDPLNASFENPALMSSRRVTRSQSQASSRLSSANPSPRKQTFALDVGDQRSPQKILVTVEADDRDTHGSNVKRKLFQSPTPKRVTRRREKTTTTVVPLKGLTDDEEGGEASISVAPTPKRRGRPPKSAGTPAKAAKEKAAPIRKTPALPRRAKASLSEDLTSDVSVPDPDVTPKPTRTRTSTKRKNDTPAKEAGETPKPKRRGRPRRETITADEIRVGAAQSDTGIAEGEDNASVATTEDNTSVAGRYASAAPSSHGGDDDDIWVATLSDPPSQHLSRQESPVQDQQMEPDKRQEAQLPSGHRQTETEERSEAHDDYGAAGGYSETESVASNERRSSPDKDTIMVQEEFTMISIHSLPSMQGNLSVAAAQQETGDETNLLINQTLESLRHSRTESRPKTPYEDEVSFVGPSPEPNRTPILSNNSMFAPPASSPKIRQSPRRTRTQDLGRQLALKSLHKQQVAESPQRDVMESEVPTEPADEPSLYDDSFSEIPEAVLEAATPKLMRRATAEVYDDSSARIPDVLEEETTPRPSRQALVEDQESLEPSAQTSVERPLRVPPPNPQSESNRLLTPDETPSPVESENDEDRLQSAMKEGNEAEMQSSPPVPGFPQQEQSSAARRSRRASSETPALHVPSSRSPPRIEVAKAEPQSLAPPDSAARSMLSPIVRAGRALQMVTSDPPSPPARSPSLGSPFRASVSKSPAAAQPATTLEPATAPVQQSSPGPRLAPTAVAIQEPLPAEEQRNSPWSGAFAPFKQIQNLVSQGVQAFSPRADSSPAGEGPSVAPTAHSAPRERQDTLSMHNSIFTLGGGGVGGASRTSSVEAEAAYDDEMSWQADETPAPRFHAGSGSASSTVRARKGSDEMTDADMESLVEESFVQEDDGEERGQASDFDDDIWAVEAQRPTPGRPQQEAVEREPTLNPPRRSKLPSPWRQNSKRLVYNDERHKFASDTADKEEDFSLLSQFGSKKPEVVAQPAEQAKKVDLSAFFSSPALLPEVLPPGVSYPKPAQRPPAREAETRPSFANALDKPAERPAEVEPEEQPRATPSVVRRIFSFGRRSGEPQSNLTAAPAVSSVPQKELQIGTQRRVDLFSPVKPAGREEREAVGNQSSPSTPPSQLFPHVPQKRNFTPRSGQVSNSLFAPSPAGRPTASLESPDDLSEDEDVAEEESSSQYHSTSPHQESSFVPPVLKPLPDRARSPSKSCIRSPLKPKTPGRVVEFASSTLSPLAQAQARAEQRNSSPSRPPPSTITAEYLNKENRPTPASSARGGISEAPTAGKPSSLLLPNSITRLSPPTTTTTTTAATLSANAAAPLPRHGATAWTRAHWERLDALLQQRRAGGALAFQLAHPVPKRNSARPKLLGKQVVAQGETMTLRQWHLDVVDAFAAETSGGTGGGEGGWDERVLAKRLFALLVGEERRRKGVIDRSRRGVEQQADRSVSR